MLVISRKYRMPENQRRPELPSTSALQHHKAETTPQNTSSGHGLKLAQADKQRREVGTGERELSAKQREKQWFSLRQSH